VLAGVHIAAASEAIAFAARQGMDIAKVYEVITASAGNSWMFENRIRMCWMATIPRAARSISSSRTSASSRHGAQRQIPGAGVGCGAADVFDDFGGRHGPRRRRLGGADVCEGHRHRLPGDKA